jgi:hypothetical protein
MESLNKKAQNLFQLNSSIIPLNLAQFSQLGHYFMEIMVCLAKLYYSTVYFYTRLKKGAYDLLTRLGWFDGEINRFRFLERHDF